MPPVLLVDLFVLFSFYRIWDNLSMYIILPDVMNPDNPDIESTYDNIIPHVHEHVLIDVLILL